MELFHQLGKDLTWIRHLAGQLEHGTAKEALQGSAAKIREVSEEMAHRVRQFLHVRTADGAAAVSTIVSSAIQTAQRRRPQHPIVASLPESPPWVGADPRVRDILTNLLDNAVDACRERVTIGLSLSLADGSIRVEVVDDGDGMEPSILAHCFERGFTTKSERGGTGTGLYSSRRIADSIGATLELRSATGEGTRAVLVAPAFFR